MLGCHSLSQFVNTKSTGKRKLTIYEKTRTNEPPVPKNLRKETKEDDERLSFDFGPKRQRLFARSFPPYKRAVAA